ncbi:MAG: glycoside hydrolase family 5 protein [Ruminococcaceae bacterium]|nr:glycoside hydrolase family 5 protein [Oscillospiraceae bacterium]
MERRLICLLLSFVIVAGTVYGCQSTPAIPPTTDPGVTEPTDAPPTDPMPTDPTDPDTTDPTDAPGEEEDMENYWKNTNHYGIQVDNNGIMQLAGKDLYVAGTNCYNLFNQCFDDFSPAEAKRTLDVLKENGISIVRFNCGGYSYNDLQYYMKSPEAYLELLRQIVNYAEQLEIGLIPSFFWLYHAVPDYYDEPLRSWGRADSKTVQFLCDYTTNVVSKLKDSKAIFAWEFGNEFNLSCDLPNADEHMPALPSHSKRTQRTKEDYLSAEDVNYAIVRFSQAIHAIDNTGRMITSGNATLRPSQYNQLKYNSWNQDTYEEYKHITAMFTPEGVDTISEHVYFQSQKTFGKDLSLSQYLSYVMQAAREQKKAYFVGEWGGGSDEDMTSFREIGNDFVDAGVQICLLWNFNLNEGSVEYSYAADSLRGQRLFEVLRQLNHRYQTEFNL